MRLYVCHAAPPWYAPCPGAEAVKIGVSADPFKRKWSLRRKGCESPKLIWESEPMPDAMKIEALVKKVLRPKCVGGTEWFDLPPADAIEAVQDVIRYAEDGLAAGLAWSTLRRTLGKRNRPDFGKALTKARKR